jgi:hypothetical protein
MSAHARANPDRPEVTVDDYDGYDDCEAQAVRT